MPFCKGMCLSLLILPFLFVLKVGMLNGMDRAILHALQLLHEYRPPQEITTITHTGFKQMFKAQQQGWTNQHTYDREERNPQAPV